MIETTQMRETAAQKRDAELSLLGINTQESPRLSVFPSKFDRRNFYIWQRLFKDEELLKKTRKKTSTNDQWQLVIQEYLRLCQEDGAYPFTGGSINANNDMVKSFLLDSRIRVCKFYNENEFFTRCSIAKVTREYHFSNGAMTLSMGATLRPNSIDPTLEQWLTKLPTPSFKRDSSAPSLYSKDVNANVSLTVKFRGKLRVELGYKIFCHSSPLIDGNLTKIPTKVQLAKFVETNIWLPLVRAHRIDGIGMRLF